MKRTRIFTLIMAIVWTVIGSAAVVVAAKSDLGTGMDFLIVILAVVAVVGNWMRYLRSR